MAFLFSSWVAINPPQMSLEHPLIRAGCLLRISDDPGNGGIPNYWSSGQHAVSWRIDSVVEFLRRLVDPAVAPLRKYTEFQWVLSVRKMVANGVTYELRDGGHPHLFQDARTMGAYGRSAQMELLGDLSHRFPGGDHQKDLELSR
jgi:hypothetical protein